MPSHPTYDGPCKVRILPSNVFGEDIGEKWKHNRNNGRGNYGWRSVKTQAAWIRVSPTVLYAAIRDGRVQFKWVGKVKYVPSSTTKKQVSKK